MTESQKERLLIQWLEIAKESITIDKINDTIYAYGSELACLRLEYNCKYTPESTRVGFSENLNTWYFSLTN